MDFRYGAARNLYAEGQHPRIYIGRRDLSILRRRVAGGIGEKPFSTLRSRLQPYVDVVADGRADTSIDANVLTTRWTPENCFLRGARDVAFACAMTGDVRMLHGLRRLLVSDPVGECGGSGPNAVIADAFDLVYHLLEPKVRRIVARRLLADAKERIKRSCDSYYYQAARNITIDETLPAITSLLAIRNGPGLPSVEGELTRLIGFLDATLQAQLGRDGYPEGDIGYGSMEGANLAFRAESLRRAGLYDPYTGGRAYRHFGRAMLHMG